MSRAFAIGPLYAGVVIFSNDAGPTLGAPVVELLSWIFPSSEITPELTSKVTHDFDVIAKTVSESPEAAGGFVSGWGQIEFDCGRVKSRRWTCLIGWKSVEAHYACKETTPYQDNIHHVMNHGHTGLEMVHFAYSRVST